MASYLVRANFVSIDVLKVCLDLMCQWLHDYLNEVDDTDGVIKVGMLYHPAFYYLCQTVFYIFNFHHKTLLDADRNFILQLNFERIISSKLNPLKMCKTSIVNQFASITSKYEIIFCYTIIEANKRLFLPLFLTEANYGSPEMLFPYEPYNLKRSGQHINHLYLHHHSEESEDINKETPPQTHEQAPSSDSTTNN
jgi:RNA polymerase I-specific transcription initiation factor RRN3